MCHVYTCHMAVIAVVWRYKNKQTDDSINIYRCMPGYVLAAKLFSFSSAESCPFIAMCILIIAVYATSQESRGRKHTYTILDHFTTFKASLALVAAHIWLVGHVR